MKKSIWKKISALFLGLSMGLGVAVGAVAGNKVSEVKAENGNGSVTFAGSSVSGWAITNQTTYCSLYYSGKNSSASISNKAITGFENFATSSSSTLSVTVSGICNSGTNSVKVSTIDSSGTVVDEGTPKTSQLGSGSSSNNAKPTEAFTFTPGKSVTGLKIDIGVKCCLTGISWSYSYDKNGTTGEETSDGTFYSLVTSTSELESNKNYIIGNANSGDSVFMSVESNSNNRKITSAFKVGSDGKVKVNDSALVLKLGGSSGAWTFLTTNYKGTDGYLASASSGNNNYCRVIADSTTGTISFSSNAAVITLQPHSSRNILRYNSSSSCFACYSSGQAAVYLFKEISNEQKYSVQINKTNVNTTAATGADAASNTQDYTASFTPSTGYNGVALDSVKIGTTALTSLDYTWNSNTLTITKTKINGNIEITVHGTKSPYTVSATGTGVAFQSPTPSAEYGTAYSISYSVDSSNGYEEPVSITTKVGGEEVTPTLSGTTISIPAASVTGNIEITANATLHTYDLTKTLEHVIFVEEDSSSLEHGGSFAGTLVVDTGYTLEGEGAIISIKMGESPVSDECIDGDYIQIDGVNGDITITAKAVRSSEPDVRLDLEELVLNYNETKKITFEHSNVNLVDVTPTLEEGDEAIVSFGTLDTNTGELEITGIEKGISNYTIRVNYTYGDSLEDYKDFILCVEVDRSTSIVNNLTNVTSNNDAESIEYGATYSAVLTPGNNKYISSGKLTVFGDEEDISEDVVVIAEYGTSATITIENACYDTITITAQSTTISARSLTIDDTNVKKEYYLGEVFSIENLTITANMNDGTTRNPQNVANQVTAPNMNEAATDVNVQISYLSKTESYSINIYDITDFVIEGTATATEGDEEFDLSSLSVYPVYNGKTSTLPLVVGTYSLSTESIIALSTKSISVLVNYKGSSSETNLKTITVDNVSAKVEKEPTMVTFDLSTKSKYTTNSTEELSWVDANNIITALVKKGDATTNTNNYTPDTSGQNYKSTRFYKNSNLSFSAIGGYYINSIVLDATSENYANALAQSEFEGATATSTTSETTYLVTITPSSEKTSTISAVVGDTCGFYSIKVYYSQDTSIDESGFISAVEAIPSPVTSLNVETVEELISLAEVEYNKLSSELKDLLNVCEAYKNLQTLKESCEETKLRLQAQEVIDLIAALPEADNIIDYSYHDDIVAAKNAYNQLSEDAKQFVTNFSKLTACEAADFEFKPLEFDIDTSGGYAPTTTQNPNPSTCLDGNADLFDHNFPEFSENGLIYVSSSLVYSNAKDLQTTNNMPLKLGTSNPGSLVLKMDKKYQEITSVTLYAFGWYSSKGNETPTITINKETNNSKVTNANSFEYLEFTLDNPSNQIEIASSARCWIYGLHVEYQNNLDIKACYDFETNYIQKNIGYPETAEDGVDTGACRGEDGYYARAKAAFIELSSNTKEFFATDEDFTNARARFEAWAKANGETINWTNGTFSSNRINPNISLNIVESTTWIIAIVALAGLTAIGGYFFYRKRKENI